MSDIYTPQFYQYHSSSSKASSEEVLKVVFNTIGLSSSAIDIGCGVGTWAATMLSMNVKTVLAVDGGHVPRNQLQISADYFLSLDLESECLTNTIKKKFDFLCCLEVAEHLSEKRAESFVFELTNLSENILFSAAIPYQGGTNHTNCQWQSYWVGLFARHGYFPHNFVRERTWNNSKINFWYRQNCLFFSKKQAEQQIIFDIVHPEFWERVMQSPFPLYNESWLAQQAASLAGKEVYFWGCGATYQKYRRVFAEARPRCLLVDFPDAPQSVDGIPVKHPAELYRSPLPPERLRVVVFTRAMHYPAIAEKQYGKYSSLVEGEPVWVIEHQ